MEKFRALGISEINIQTLEKKGFEEPTEIQSAVIPLILEDEIDIIAQAQTGTGKTAAFGLPLIEQIDIHDKQTQVLILAPTRELCMQISKDFQNYSKIYRAHNLYSFFNLLIPYF